MLSGRWVSAFLMGMTMALGLALGAWPASAVGKGASGEVLRVGLLADFPPFESWSQEHSEPEGLDVELLGKLAECCGLRFEFQRFVRFDHMLRALAQGQIHVITAVAMLPERARFLRFTRPYATVPQAFVGRSSDTSAPSTPDLAGLRLGVTQGYVSEWLAQARFPLASRASEATVPEGLDAVREGRSDLLLEALPTLQALLERPSYRDLQIKRTFAFQEGRLRLATSIQNEGLARRLDEALGRLTHAELSELRARWIQPWQPPTVLPALPEHASAALRVGYLSSDTPVIDTRSGEPQGVTIELMKVVAERAALRVDSFKAVSPAMAAQSLARGELDVVLGARETHAARTAVQFVGPYRSNPVAIVSHKNYSVGDLDQLAGRRLAVPQSQVAGDMVRASHPEIEVVPCKDLADCMEMLEQGRAEASLYGLQGLQEQLAARPSQGLQVTGVLPGVVEEDSLAVSRTNVALAQRLRDALAQSLVLDLPHIERAWVEQVAQRVVDWQRVRWWSSAVVLALFPLMGAWFAHSRSLRREVVRRQQAQEGAERAYQLSEQYLAFMAHEVRNALQSVAGAVSMLRKAWPSPGTPGHLLEAIAQSTRSTLLLLTALLDRHRLKDGRLGLALCGEQVGATVDAVVNEVRPAMLSKGLILQVERHGDLDAWVMIDALRVQQVIRNLLVNALKFSEHGTIRVVVMVVALETGLATRKRIEIRVADEGPGMDAAMQARAFSGEVSVGGDRPGTGLGLALSRELAVAMGGSLNLRSAPGQGSEFVLSFEADLAPQNGLHQGPTKPLKVLLAEDEPVYALLLQQAFAQQGCECTLAGSIAEAHAVLRESAFDLALCDSHLPDGHAVDLLAGWPRGDEGVTHGSPEDDRTCVVIGMSAELQQGDALRLKAAGATAALVKDADAAAMVARVLRAAIKHWPVDERLPSPPAVPTNS